MRNIVLKSSFARSNNSFLNFCHFNCNSLVSHFDEVKNDFKDVPFDIIAISESWLLKNKHENRDFQIPGYKIERHDRQRSDRHRGGGVLIYISKNVQYRILEKSGRNSFTEYLFIEICNGSNEKMVFGVIYNPPQTNIMPYVSELFSNLATSYEKVFICGDMNLNLLKNTGPAKAFVDFLSSLNFSNINSLPTNFVNDSETLIDLSITNSPSSILMLSQIDGFCSHDLIYGTFQFNLKNVSLNKTIKLRSFKNIDNDLLLMH